MGGEVLSVNVAKVRMLERRGEQEPTGIWKHPVDGRVALRGVQVEGDTQSNLKVHGGYDQAVYAYAREDYDIWEAELGRELEPGLFGENLTIRGVDASGALVGERWRVGSALLEVSAPRIPCWKLGRKMGDPKFVKRFGQANRPGAYLRIIEEGEVGVGDAVRVTERPAHDVSVALVSRALLGERELAPRILTAGPALPDKVRDWAEERAAA
jgi:MOSC domain-containing protein YiiM